MRIAFVHGRPGPHPFHALLAKSVNADFHFPDPVMRWHDRSTSRWYRNVSMVVCSLLFSRKSRYDALISEGPHTIPVLTRMFTVGSRPKAVALMANETLYFLKSGYYEKRTHSKILSLLSRFDALICIGSMEVELAYDALREITKKPSIYLVHSCLSDGRWNELNNISPPLEGTDIVFVGNGGSGWMSWYKGLDLLLDTAQKLSESGRRIFFTIVGHWEEEHIDKLLSSRPGLESVVRFVGALPSISDPLSKASLYIHLGRGEAFGISVLEAMSAGLPCIVSEWTGAKEAVAQVSEDLIVPIDAEAAARKALWYFDLPQEIKASLSDRSREVAKTYTEERAIREFQSAIETIVRGGIQKR